jgi:hypothetical protein
MTATTITCLTAREHVNDLLLDAERARLAAELGPPRRVRRWLSNPFARRVPRPATA